MFIYLVFAFVIILVKNLPNKRHGLIMSFIILFVILGFQYEMTQDWHGYVARWNFANNGGSGQASRDLEEGYVLLMKICNPLTYFGFLALCVGFNLLIVFYFFKKFVLKEYWWVGMSVFLLDVNLCFMMVNTNRQYITVSLSLLIVLILIDEYFNCRNNIKIEKYLYALAIFFIGVSIHTAMYGASIIFFIPLFISILKKLDTGRLLIVVNILFFGRYFFSLGQFQDVVVMHMDTNALSDYSGYMGELDNSSRQYSIFESSLFLLIINGCAYFYKNAKFSTQFFFTMTIIAIVADGYFFHTLARTFTYYNYVLMFTVPLLLEEWKNTKLLLSFRKPICMYALVYLIYSFARETIFGAMPYYKRWMEYRSVFDAPFWM